MRLRLPICLPLVGIALAVILSHRTQSKPATASSAADTKSAATASPLSVVSHETPRPSETPERPARAAALSEQISTALRHGTPADRERAFELLPQLVATDPSGAGHLALAWEPGALHDQLLREVVRRWCEIDAGATITWLTSLLDPDDRRLAAATLIEQVSPTDPASALDLAAMLHVGLDDGTSEHVAQVWTEDNPGAALDWVRRQPHGPHRDRLLARMAWVRVQSEPAEAADLVLNHMQSGEAQTEALAMTVRQWAIREPGEATEWVSRFPPGALRTRAVAELALAARQRPGSPL